MTLHAVSQDQYDVEFLDGNIITQASLTEWNGM